MGLPRRKASLHQNWRDARESEKRGISTFERTNSWVARSESLVRDESQDENSLIQDDTTSQDQSVSFILRDSCYLQAMVTFFYHCQIICLCQARLLFSAGRRLFLAWAYREEISINDAPSSSSSIFRCCLSCASHILFGSVASRCRRTRTIETYCVILNNPFHHDNE